MGRLKTRRWLRVVGAVVVTGVVVGLAGPRTSTRIHFGTPALPSDLDTYVARMERRFPDITPGAEKLIVWADRTAREATPVSVVYIHGFSATRQEIRPVAERVARGLGANLFLTRLRGHGQPGEALARASLNDWAGDVAEAVEIGRRLGRRVVLMGTSTGAALALWAAAQERWQDRLEALVLVSPNFRPADPGARVLSWPWGATIARIAVGDVRSWEPYNPGHARYWTTRYPVEALLPMAALVQTVSRLDLADVRAPTLVLYSSLDKVVSVDAILQAVPRLGGQPTRAVDVGPVGDPDNHVLGGDILSPEDTDRVVRAILDFFETLE